MTWRSKEITYAAMVEDAVLENQRALRGGRMEAMKVEGGGGCRERGTL
jgi:hypothetical protein